MLPAASKNIRKAYPGYDAPYDPESVSSDLCGLYPLPLARKMQAKRTKRVGASSRVRGRELSYGVHSIRLHHPTSGLNSPPFSVARVFCISLQYFHLSALPLTVPLQKAALVSAYSVTGKPLLFVSLFHRRCKQRKALCIRGLKHFLPTLFVL